MRKVIADMHVPPKAKRWAKRVGLIALVALLIGYLPSQLLARDPKAAKLAGQLQQIEAQTAQLSAELLQKRAQVEALRTDVRAIEAHARRDLGMVYRNEVVIRVVGVAP